MKTLFLIILLSVSSAAASSEIVINLASVHINSVVDYNEQNYGLGYRTDNNIEFGFFRNSYYDLNTVDSQGTGYSPYIKGSLWNTALNPYIKLGIDIGLAYYGKDGPIAILPIVQPLLTISPLTDININVGYVPMLQKLEHTDADGTTTEKTMYGMVTLSVSYTF